MSSFVEDVTALVSIEIDRRDETENAFDDERLDAFLETCEDKNMMLIMLASYVAADFTAEQWRERMADFWPVWDSVRPND